MSASRRILYVVSFDATEAAVTWQVAELARAWCAAVVLLAPRRRRWIWRLGAESREDVGRRLSAVAVRLKGYVADIRVAEDPLADAVTRVARDVGAKLVLVGAGERALREPTYVGPEALELARHVGEDIWICKPFADPRVEHVLCAADTSPTAGAAVTRAVHICRRFNARLRILSVMPQPSRFAQVDDPEEEMHARRTAQKSFLDQFDLQGVALSRAIVWAHEPSAEVLHEAERYSDGLLVIGASSQTHPAHGQLGPTSEAILRACPSSLLIIKKRMSADPAKKPRLRVVESQPGAGPSASAEKTGA
jgi:nucleotide-binding universal stress UspA family protein